MEDRTVFIAGVLIAIISPIVTLIGLILQHFKDINKEKLLEKIRDAEARKSLADSDKARAEAEALSSKTDMDSINFYIGMVTALRTEVTALTEVSRKNGAEIAVLTSKLAVADAEKMQLSREKEALAKEVQTLREEVSVLKREIEIVRNNEKKENK